MMGQLEKDMFHVYVYVEANRANGEEDKRRVEPKSSFKLMFTT